MRHYRITSPRTGVDHGEWTGPTAAHAVVKMLRAQGIDAQTYQRVRQAALWDDGGDGPDRAGVAVHPDHEARLARLGLSLKGFRVEELQPIPMELFR